MKLTKALRAILPLITLSTVLGVPSCSFPSADFSAMTYGGNQSNSVDYLIITAESFVEQVQPLARWKSQRGLISAIETVESIGENYEGVDTAERIRSCITHYHYESNTTWVVLAGGNFHVPSRTIKVDDELVSCDYYYANLDDNWVLQPNGIARIVDIDDWEAEVYVGRLPADTYVQMNDLVSRLIEYERNPPLGPWMKNAVFAGTFCHFDTDVNSNNTLDEEDRLEFDTNRNHNWLKSNILPSNWTSTLLAEGEGITPTDYPYDEQINESAFINAVNSGACIVMADAHGSPTSMTRSIFTYDADNDSLFDFGVDGATPAPFLTTSSEFDTNGKNGFFFLAACSTGTFTWECLSEYIVRTCGIGCIASFNSAYYDSEWYDGEHLGWFTQGLSMRFWEQLLVEGINHPGMAFSLAKVDYVEDCNIMNGKKSDNGRTLAQYNLLGDPEVPIWTDIPSSITPEIEMNETSRVVNVRVLMEEQPLNEVVVTLTSSTFYYRTTTDEHGEAMLLLPNLEEPEDINLTFSKNHYLPHQEVMEAPAGSISTGKLTLLAFGAPLAVSASIGIAVVLIVAKLKRRKLAI